ncbi:2-nitropropane dioxygenase [Pochonia chlamydosporia 170]|uniref:2-nitropropane dioxygenase n=1 Tax=Pochonia chlamydosporia 170 TaxID=1380566 RepID=A0A179F967_METCM|nr:2-nitropropane dioxygenase [Pochonia chlamydosporia 170]OAQ61996.1 2-nitropropane dioxygenase [Pochonia chlamydosporia 170]
MSPAKLQEWFPWTQSPIISNGPMMGVVNPKLAAEVTKAGGLGFLPCVFDIAPNSEHLSTLTTNLKESRSILGLNPSDTLNLGISFLTGHGSITNFSETIIPIVAEYRPAAVWLFAPNEDVKPHGAIIQALKKLDHSPRVFVQVGNVAAARAAVRDGADVLVCQGIDAGGHQFRRGMGVVSFVPEAKAMLEEEFAGREVGVFAAGGIVNGKGVAAAMALGAGGVVMGTRFTVARESTYPDFRKEIVLKAVDGGSSTFKSPFNDEINNSALFDTLWGTHYDGRSIITSIHEKFLAGSTLQELQKSLKEDYSSEESMRLINTWAGTGVGLVNTALPAGEIVKEVREDAKETIRNLAAQL